MRFIPPARPSLRTTPPRGPGWVHEVKFDGWRIQLHKHERGASIYTRNGHDFTKRFPTVSGLVLLLPVRTCIIDGELSACTETGLPDFRALHFRTVEERDLCVWAFDLLELDGEDLRALPLASRKSKLARLVYKARKNWLRLSEFRRRPEAPSLLREDGAREHHLKAPRLPLPLRRSVRLDQGQVRRVARGQPRPSRTL
jgi:bifunctional non-homologous end joining protein LigD